MKIGYLSLLTVLFGRSYAWVTTPATASTPRSSTVLKATSEQEGPAATRRQWLSAATSAAAVTGWTSLPSIAVGSNTAVDSPPKPVISNSNTCDTSVSVWTQPGTGRLVYLLGTSHVSSSSAKLAGRLVNDVRPQAVFVELDKKRINTVSIATAAGAPPLETKRETSGSDSAGGKSMMEYTKSLKPSFQEEEDSDEEMPVLTTEANYLGSGTEGFAAMRGLMSPTGPSPKSSSGESSAEAAFASEGPKWLGRAIDLQYDKLAESGFSSGEDILSALKAGKRVGAKLILGDQDVEITLKRLAEAIEQTDRKALSDKEVKKSMSQFLPTGPEPTDDEGAYEARMAAYIETSKSKESVKLKNDTLKQLAPKIYEATIGERDAYMANGLDKLKMFPSIVAVMGLTHVGGVEAILQERGWEAAPLVCTV